MILYIVLFSVKNLAVTNAEFPLTNDLLGFLRIFCISEGKYLNNVKFIDHPLTKYQNFNNQRLFIRLSLNFWRQ